MIVKHFNSGNYYRYLFKAFNVETQTNHAVYLCMKTGVVFTRNFDVFKSKFDFIKEPTVTPKERG